ncbi:MAG: hypothetical protein JNL98_19950 [Bryobacterales bacterium]|nr:hypothetical protein [Bryobacterales bacterium]
MSYLDLPRLQFGGLFFTGPNTINNITPNYESSTNLEDSNHTYIPQVAGWNALGVAQWWIEECTILSGVAPNGNVVTSGDAVIGAPFESPSPSTPKTGTDGAALGIAKMVDLDPDQQGRSAVYGLYLFVTLPNGAGFSGLLTVPELRQLNPRVSGNATGSWFAVGSWMGVIQSPVWSGDISSSPLLTALKAAAVAGIAVRFIVDLHQNNPKNQLTAGDLFCYGRIQGSIGPALANELAQVVPGRQLVAPPPNQPPHVTTTRAAAVEMNQRQVPARQAVVMRSAALPVAATTTVNPVVNPAFALVRGNLLHFDMGASVLLAMQSQSPPAANGTYLDSTGFQLGVNVNSVFTPLSAGAISFANQYINHPSQNKNCVLVGNSGMVTIPLTSNDQSLLAANPMALTYKGAQALVEQPSGIWADVSLSSTRLEIGGQTTSASVQVMMRKFGQPYQSTQAPVKATVQELVWVSPYDPNNNPQATASTDLTVSVTPPNAAGIATVTVTLSTTGNTLPPPRAPINGVVYFVQLNDLNGNPIGDTSPFNSYSGTGNGTISVLVWNSFQAPPNPQWADIGAVFGAYARLYPGMKSKLDISDQTTVTGFAGDVIEHMTAPIEDPAYMPVTRDLQPAKIAMIVNWLKQLQTS